MYTCAYVCVYARVFACVCVHACTGVCVCVYCELVCIPASVGVCVRRCGNMPTCLTILYQVASYNDVDLLSL